jgi:hypothetical protein
LPAVKVILPSGNVIRPSGNVILPAGKVILPAGKVVWYSEREPVTDTTSESKRRRPDRLAVVVCDYGNTARRLLSRSRWSIDFGRIFL